MLQWDHFQWAKLSLFMFSNCILSLSMAVHRLPLQKVCAKTHSLWYELPVTTQRSLIPHWYFSQVCDNIQCPTRHCHDCLAFVPFQTCQRYNKAPVWEGSEKTECFCQGWNQRATYAVLPRSKRYVVTLRTWSLGDFKRIPSRYLQTSIFYIKMKWIIFVLSKKSKSLSGKM